MASLRRTRVTIQQLYLSLHTMASSVNPLATAARYPDAFACDDLVFILNRLGSLTGMKCRTLGEVFFPHPAQFLSGGPLEPTSIRWLMN
jgi:hypothetical protein